MSEILKYPKVSVCVITFNQENYIRQCLQSIVDQVTDFEFEVIVGDDCSTDGTRAIVQEFAERHPKIVKPIYQEFNIGKGCNNYLSVHKAAGGEYIAHVDGDDCCLPNKLSIQASYLDKNPNCMAVVHKLAMRNNVGTLIPGTWPARFSYRKYDLAKIAIGHPVFGHSSLMYRNGGLANLDLNQSGLFIDFYIYVHLSSQGNIGTVDQVLGQYTCGVGSSSAETFIELAKEALLYARKTGLADDYYYSALARQYLIFARKALVENDYERFDRLISLSVNSKVISTQQVILHILRKNKTLAKLLKNYYRSIKSWVVRLRRVKY